MDPVPLFQREKDLLEIRWTNPDSDPLRVTHTSAENAADNRDVAAVIRNAHALVRDQRAAERDSAAVAGHVDVAAIVELQAAERVAAAGDRQAARADREAAYRDRVEATAQLTAQGLDDLTGVMRRGVGLAAIQREMHRCSRGRDPLVIAFVDVDGLKRTNTDHGHAAGDRLLCTVASAIQASLRSYDVTVRLGGDEFICGVIGDVESVTNRFERIRAAIQNSSHGSTVTVGLAQMEPGDGLSSLLARADQAMRMQRMRSAAT